MLASPRPVRCAIYTRKSTEEGLEQAFNSLHAQREAAEAYIQSQMHAGWTVIQTRFDDGGPSGSAAVKLRGAHGDGHVGTFE
jgi:DNA invertase Pin-like site-specific DNA recombinase